jgi:hypothetical protein
MSKTVTPSAPVESAGTVVVIVMGALTPGVSVAAALAGAVMCKLRKRRASTEDKLVLIKRFVRTIVMLVHLSEN